MLFRSRNGDDHVTTVIIPEFVVTHWWEQVFHNQNALALKARLLFRPRTVVTSVPFHVGVDDIAEPGSVPPTRKRRDRAHAVGDGAQVDGERRDPVLDGAVGAAAAEAVEAAERAAERAAAEQ